MPKLVVCYRNRSYVTKTDVTLTSHAPCSIDMLSEQGTVPSRSQMSEATRGWERCDLDKPLGSAV